MKLFNNWQRRFHKSFYQYCLCCPLVSRITTESGWQPFSQGSVCGSRLPVPPSCCPTCKRLLWTTAPACAQLQQQYARCESQKELAPAEAGCGSWLGPLASQLGDLSQEKKNIYINIYIFQYVKGKIKPLNMKSETTATKLSSTTSTVVTKNKKHSYPNVSAFAIIRFKFQSIFIA